MVVKLIIQGGLSVISKGKSSFEVDGQTVGECLHHLASLVPKMNDSLFFKSGEDFKLRSYIKVLVNKKEPAAEVLATTVKDGDEIKIKKDIH